MTCPECGSNKIKCLDSRKQNDQVRRRKECLCCQHRFNTYEIREEDLEALEVGVEGYARLTKAMIRVAQILKQEGFT